MKRFNKNNTTKINDQIIAKEVRVIDEKGNDLGVKTIEEALSEAEKSGMDLIEVASQAKPPVTKILDYDKFRYEQEKKEKQKKKQQKGGDTKKVQITPRTAKNDLDLKARRVIKFLEEGNRVEIQIFLKGREKANKDFAKKKLEEFLDSLLVSVDFKRLSAPRYSGRGFQLQIVKK